MSLSMIVSWFVFVLYIDVFLSLSSVAVRNWRNVYVCREVARLAKEEIRLIPEPNVVLVETRKGLQMYGCMAIVICMYFVGMYVDYL